jgi:hypothetical protein
MVHLHGASSNLFKVLEEWNATLQHTSLGRGELKAANEEGKDGSAPRDTIPAVVRRRNSA